MDKLLAAIIVPIILDGLLLGYIGYGALTSPWNCTTLGTINEVQLLSATGFRASGIFVINLTNGNQIIIHDYDNNIDGIINGKTLLGCKKAPYGFPWTINDQYYKVE
jgi:hypothetical protein